MNNFEKKLKYKLILTKNIIKSATLFLTKL